MADWKIKLELETDRFRDNVKKIILLSKKEIPEIVNDCAVMFTQSAGKATPSAKTKKRKIISATERDMDFKIAARWPKWALTSGFCVYFSRIAKSYREFFKHKSDAERSRKITYWGINKYGWLGNLLKMNKKPNMSNQSNLNTLVNKICLTTKEKNKITIINRVQKIGKWADYTKKEGLFSANKRMEYLIKKLEKDILSVWR